MTIYTNLGINISSNATFPRTRKGEESQQTGYSFRLYKRKSLSEKKREKGERLCSARICIPIQSERGGKKPTNHYAGISNRSGRTTLEGGKSINLSGLY